MSGSNYCEKWLRKLFDHVSPNFYRSEPRKRAWGYVCGLLDVSVDGPATPRRQLAAYPGERRADGTQRLLTSAQWDQEQVRRDLLGFIRTQIGVHGGKLYITEMGFRKKGALAAGAQRQFSVDSARSENCQIGIVAFYETTDGTLFFVDRELFMPASWVGDQARRVRAGVPDELTYRSKSQLALEMINRLDAAGIRPDWIIVSILCPDMARIRHTLQQAGVQHVMEITPGEFQQQTRLSGQQAQKLSQAVYTPRCAHDPGTVRLRRFASVASGPRPDFEMSYLVRGIGRTATHYYAFSSPKLAGRELLDVVAGIAPMENRCRRARDSSGFGCYEVRSWHGWHRHITLAMIAHAARELTCAEKQKAQ